MDDSLFYFQSGKCHWLAHDLQYPALSFSFLHCPVLPLSLNTDSPLNPGLAALLGRTWKVMGWTSPPRTPGPLLVSMRLASGAGGGGSSWLYAGGGVPACRLNGDCGSDVTEPGEPTDLTQRGVRQSSPT